MSAPVDAGWPDEPTSGEPYQPVYPAEYWQGRREGRMQYALMRLPGLARHMRDLANEPGVSREDLRIAMRAVADTLAHMSAEAQGLIADDGQPVK